MGLSRHKPAVFAGTPKARGRYIAERRKDMKRESIIHPIPPTYDENSRILILGSFPSAKSRQAGYYYGNPKNRFWQVVAALYGEETPVTTGQRRAFLLRSRVAAWDVVASCTIEGAADSSIRDVAANDLSPILSRARIETIFCNGRTAYDLYCRFIEPETGVPAVFLPSTSPANAAWTLPRLIEAWREAGVGPRVLR